MEPRATATKATLLLLAVGLGLSRLGCNGSALDERASAARTTLPESSRAALRLAELGAAFPDLLGESNARFRELEVGRVRAELGGDLCARVTLPTTIEGWVEVENVAARLGIRFARIGAGTAPLGVSGGLALYSSESATVDDIHRVEPAGVEDFVAFRERPGVEAIGYRVDVTRVAGLRFVGGTLEFLDRSGTPRLRIALPYFIDRGGNRHPASLGVDGCRFDTDPRGPWGRPTVAPEAETCVVSVRWNALDYPILVDPSWTTTGDMVTARTQFRTAPLLRSGNVLVAGGTNGTLSLRDAELYHPDTGTFGATDVMTVPRGSPGISALASGKILVTGGSCCAPTSWLDTAEIYDEDTGHWTATDGQMVDPRQSQSQTLLPSGKVLIAGGSASGSFYQSAELYDPVDDSFAVVVGGMAVGIRSLHTGTLLSNGNVLIAGGENSHTAEIFDSGSEQFSRTGDMTSNRANHAAVSLGSGRALIVGGWDGTTETDMPLRTAEIYDANGGDFTATSGTMAERRRWPTATMLESGLALVVGGSANHTDGLRTAELFDPSSGTFSSAMQMSAARLEHTATLLANGSVLVMGGTANSGATQPALRSASLYQNKSNGSPCNDGNECHSTFCVEGTCCESECTAGLTCSTGRCTDGGGGAGGESSGGTSGGGTSGAAGSNPSGGNTMGGASGTGATSGGASGTSTTSGGTDSTSGGSSGTGTGAGGEDAGNVCSADADCADDQYCDGNVCVARTPLESACGCSVPGRHVPNETLLACVLLGGATVFRRRRRTAA